jgi:hypothetical protein
VITEQKVQDLTEAFELKAKHYTSEAMHEHGDRQRAIFVAMAGAYEAAAFSLRTLLRDGQQSDPEATRDDAASGIS